MKKIKTFLISIIFTFIFYSNVVAGTGEATEYKINIFKIELCDNSSTASVCNGAVTIFDGNSGDIDIANTTAGAAAASLGNASAATFGTAYTYLQITMGRDFTVKGSAADDSGTTCYTKSDGSAGELAKGSAESGEKVIKELKSKIKEINRFIEKNCDYVGDGYGIPTPEMNKALLQLARLEGLLFDPVYSGKGLAGMIDLIGKGYFKNQKNIVFIHTGGAAGLFAYHDILET